MRGWVYDPHSGGVKIPKKDHEWFAQRIRNYAASHYAGKYTRLDVRFRGALCYVDAFTEPEEPSEELLKLSGETRDQYMERLRNVPLHLCRLRHFTEDRWSLAHFLYSSMKYEPSFFRNGKDFGTLEEAFAEAAVFLAPEDI